MDLSPQPPLPSPCIGVCTINPDDQTCLGCFRTLAEISNWPTLDNAGRHALLEALRVRRAVAGKDRRRRTRRRAVTD